jgi:hypothetical protein
MCAGENLTWLVNEKIDGKVCARNLRHWSWE